MNTNFYFSDFLLFFSLQLIACTLQIESILKVSFFFILLLPNGNVDQIAICYNNEAFSSSVYQMICSIYIMLGQCHYGHLSDEMSTAMSASHANLFNPNNQNQSNQS